MFIGAYHHLHFIPFYTFCFAHQSIRKPRDQKFQTLRSRGLICYSSSIRAAGFCDNDGLSPERTTPTINPEVRATSASYDLAPSGVCLAHRSPDDWWLLLHLFTPTPKGSGMFLALSTRLAPAGCWSSASSYGRTFLIHTEQVISNT